MKNYKILYKENLLHNLQKFGDKKVCAMVKANAYGHGLSEIVKLCNKHVDYFGVVNVDEGIAIRKLTQKPVLICSKVNELKQCKKYNLEVMVDNEIEIKKCVKYGLEDMLHLKINCGMNRFGVKGLLNMEMLNIFLNENSIKLKSVYTHFPRTESKCETIKCYKQFEKLKSKLSQDTLVCFGGSGISDFDFKFDMLRLGIGMYGYGKKDLLPVMNVRSFVCKTFYARKGEYIGYGKGYKVERDGKFAVVPIGYGDGLRRNLSGSFFVKINQKRYKAVGNICMDAFFIKVDEKVNEGDVVEVMSDAQYLAKRSGTIPYEILTGFSSLRGKTIIM